MKTLTTQYVIYLEIKKKYIPLCRKREVGWSEKQLGEGKRQEMWRRSELERKTNGNRTIRPM